MKLWIMSDLHFEFHRDGGAAFLRSLPDVEHDVAIIPGDLCSFAMIEDSLRRLSDRFKRTVYVIGNHECYGASIRETVERAAEAAYKLPNVDHLDCEQMFIDEWRFIGAALWFPYEGRSDGEDLMNDFWQIRGLRDDVDDWNRDAILALEGASRDTIAVTHHLPSVDSVHENYARNALNQFFVGGAAHVIKRDKPKLWIHGHTHESVDVQVGETRIVCNPLGYMGSEANLKFNKSFVVEVA